jgi:hypothetical protein
MPVSFTFGNENCTYQITLPLLTPSDSGDYVIPVIPGTNIMEIHSNNLIVAISTFNLTYVY